MTTLWESIRMNLWMSWSVFKLLHTVPCMAHKRKKKKIPMSNPTSQWWAGSSSCQNWLGRAPGVSLWYVVVLPISVTELGDCHTIKLSFFHVSVCWHSTSGRELIHDGSMMGRSQQNSSNDSYSCSAFYFQIIFLNWPESQRNRVESFFGWRFWLKIWVNQWLVL